MWIAKWVEKLTNKDKYVWLHDSADIRQQRDKNKFDYSNKLEENNLKNGNLNLGLLYIF